MLWFLTHVRRSLDRDRIARAIAEAEAKSTGEVVVSLAPFFIGNIERAAERAWERLGMARTRDRNGVLLFLVPGRRKLFVRGDQGIHEKVGPELWAEVARAVSARLAERGQSKTALTDALVHGVSLVGEALHKHFPRREWDAKTNQLPDSVDGR
jgi:uncharacterized membrane protein